MAVIVSKLSKIVIAGEVKYRIKVKCLGHGFEKDRRGRDQADIFNLIQNNSQNTSVHLKALIDEEQWRIARESKRQAKWV